MSPPTGKRRNADKPVSTNQPTHSNAEFKAVPREGVFVDANEVKNSIGTAGTTLIDALSPEIFRGEQVPFARAGHIPGAHNIDPTDLVDPKTMRFIDDASLRERFAPALTKPENRIIAYCGIGVGATSDAFNLQRLGYKNVAVYDGSLAEWGMDESLPMVTGD